MKKRQYKHVELGDIELPEEVVAEYERQVEQAEKEIQQLKAKSNHHGAEQVPDGTLE